MKKGKEKASEITSGGPMIEEPITPTPEITKPETPVTVTAELPLGRPIDPNSARQKRIAELAARRANGECKRGRPVVAGSKRQHVLEARAAKVASGVVLEKGRPVDPTSKRQIELAAKEARRQARLAALNIAPAAEQA